MRRHRRIKREINNINNNNFFNPVDYFKLLNIKWQEPVITEKKFYEQNKYDSQCFSLPWADIIDRKINLNIIYETFKDVKIGNYTCCQHIYFRRLMPLLKRLNITILYSPHKVNGENNIDGIDILPCPLYAVNIEDENRNEIFKDIDFLKNERKLWYSFQGGYNNHYMNDIRKKILNLEKKPYNYLIDSKGWHFEKAVYGGDKNIITDKLESYNKLLINNRFSLCPCGSGPNSIRFWECLATGSIPILLSDTLDLPKHQLWEESIVKVQEKDLNNIEEILGKISKEKEEKMRKNCIEIYNFFKENYKGENKKITNIIHYCCGTYDRGDYGGVARYDYQIKKIFNERKFFEGPGEKNKMLEYLNKCKNPLIITDNHLSCDIPNKYKILLVHHGCARTTSERNPDWGEPWKSLCVNGQNKMLDYREPINTKIISISQACSDDFTKYYSEKYNKFKRINILHPSELDENKFKTKFNTKPIILGNWAHVKKGQKIIPHLKKKLDKFTFQQLNVKIDSRGIEDFNKRKQEIYLNADIFLQIANSEGNSYATLDALLCGLVIVASNVGLFYKDVPDNCFIKLDWTKNNDINYVHSKIEEAWVRKEELSKNARKWYMENCRFIDWEKKMKMLI